jgi:hypothetical protein
MKNQDKIKIIKINNQFKNIGISMNNYLIADTNVSKDAGNGLTVRIQLPELSTGRWVIFRQEIQNTVTKIVLRYEPN